MIKKLLLHFLQPDTGASRLLYLSISAVLMLFGFSALLKAQKPNILLIISDDLNTRIGPYMDIEKHTPNLNKLAENGVRFTGAYCQYPLCGPSRASFMSGLYPETNGVLRNNDQPGSYKTETPSLADHPSMAGFFREHGYFTARVSKIYHMGVPGGIERGDPGGDDPTSWDYAYNVMGPETLSGGEMELLSPKNPHYGSNFSRMILPDELKYTQTDYLATSQAIAILESRAAEVAEGATNKVKIKPDEPFFLAVGMVRPHVPLIATKECFEPYPYEEMELPNAIIGEDVPEQALRKKNEYGFGMDEIQQKKTISAYMGSVQFMDQQVGRLLNTLDRLNLRDNTIVIFISDHGYNLGEHNCWSKVSLWEGSVRVPMIVSVPGEEYEENYGTIEDGIIELIDLYPTLTDLCGYSEKTPEILQGISLKAALKAKGEISDKIAYTISYGGNAATIRTKRYRYTRWGAEPIKGNEELYDHNNDPEEHFNLADEENMKEVLNEMRQLYNEAKKRSNPAIIY